MMSLSIELPPRQDLGCNWLDAVKKPVFNWLQHSADAVRPPIW